MKKNVLIIGAGPAGLTAAYELQKETEHKVTIWEGENHIGGIAATAEYQGNYMDMGGHRFFTKVPQVQALWQELLPLQGKPAKDEVLLGEINKNYEGLVDPEHEDTVLLKRRRVSRIYYLRHFFSYPISVSMEMLRNLGFVRLVNIGCSYVYSMLCKRPEHSLEDFYINRFGKVLYSMFFENYTEKIWGIHPSKISPDWGAQRVKGLSILGILKNLAQKALGDSKHIETSLIEEFYYPKFGPGQMWETLAQRITDNNGSIVVDRRVMKLAAREKGGYIATAVDHKGQKYSEEFDLVISSMAIADLVQVLPNVPSDTKSIASELPYRDFITVGLLMKKLKLKNNTIFKTVSNIVPDCWIYVQEHGVKLGRLQIFNNWSPYLVNDLEHSVWMGLEYFCNEGDALWNMSKDSFISMAIKEVASIGVIAEEDVLEATQVKVKKAYPAYFGSYTQFDKVKDYLLGVPDLYCIGRNGQHKYNNMDHSMLTAIEVVKAIQGKKPYEEVWQVNTEKEYHEEIKANK